MFGSSGLRVLIRALQKHIHEKGPWWVPFYGYGVPKGIRTYPPTLGNLGIGQNRLIQF